MLINYNDCNAKKKKFKIRKGRKDLNKNKKNQNETRLVKNKETIRMKFINTIKKRWLISGTNTLLLIAILILVVISE